ncbi:hypothetical protein [Cesiribacter sp. SM1]|uniref:hypothetical protein n=1 Tax=Cesiribacter sp. SM1 TaxID=2861196 RepID=UPI001CD60113|nr:hypothetical protein [Cesiribacter sp. SM1]
MEQKTLKYLRIFIPGVMILLGGYPIYYHYFAEAYDLSGLNVTYATYLSVLLGAIYYQLDIQRLITKPSHYFITNNILNKLIKAYDREVSKNEKKSLVFKDNYMTVFYHIIDNDESLKRKGENVRFNGIFWTSTADSFLINMTFYFLYAYFPQLIDVILLRKIFLFAAIISLALHIISVIKHIRLSNKQLNPIVHDKNLSLKVKNKFDEILH